jgi:hypothetical protein
MAHECFTDAAKQPRVEDIIERLSETLPVIVLGVDGDGEEFRRLFATDPEVMKKMIKS